MHPSLPTSESVVRAVCGTLHLFLVTFIKISCFLFAVILNGIIKHIYSGADGRQNLQDDGFTGGVGSYGACVLDLQVKTLYAPH